MIDSDSLYVLLSYRDERIFCSSYNDMIAVLHHIDYTTKAHMRFRCTRIGLYLAIVLTCVGSYVYLWSTGTEETVLWW